MICPVRAFKKWQAATSSYQMDQPAFRLENGAPVTANLFNNILKERLKDKLGHIRITAHSFRGGAASMMASLGYSDKEIKAVGRWNSRAVEAYVKQGWAFDLFKRSKKIEDRFDQRSNRS